jgi:2-polyprenyl-3-methyl-5-hydroxy-6-metoxy-1,4-benzoquinol methylase
MIRLAVDELKKLASDVHKVSPPERDEMAIPSYLHANPLIRWLMWRRYERIERMAELAPGKAVLEFGCGMGVFLPTLCASGAKVYAVDLFPQFAVRLAETRGLDVAFVQSVSDVPDGSLDVIVAADVLEHIDEPAEYLALFARKLKSDGKLIVSGPTENICYKIGRLVAGFGDKGEYHHSDIGKLAVIIANNGYRAIRSYSLPFCIPPYLFRVIDFCRSEGTA